MPEWPIRCGGIRLSDDGEEREPCELTQCRRHSLFDRILRDREVEELLFAIRKNGDAWRVRNVDGCTSADVVVAEHRDEHFALVDTGLWHAQTDLAALVEVGPAGVVLRSPGRA